MSRDTPVRLLCLVPNWIGDAVMSLPALQLLATSGAAIHLVGPPAVRRIVTEAAAAASWDDLPASRSRRLRLALALRPGRLQAAILLTPSFSSALFARITGVPVRCGEASDARGFLLSHPLPRLDRRRHLAASFEDIAARGLAALGMASPPAAASDAPAPPHGLRRWPRLQVRSDERAALEQLPPAVRGAVVVAPGARFGPSKRYPPERFAAAARSLAASWRCGVVVVGAAADAEQTAAVAQGIEGALDLAGRTDLGTLLAVLDEARVVLSNDSGIMHLAAALGRPVVGVFGSTNPAWTAPLGPRSLALSHPVFCWPCHARTCREDFACMLGQPAEKLIAACRRLVENGAA